MDDSAITRLDAEHLARVLDLRPEAATLLGFAAHDERWGPSGPQADRELADLLQAWAQERAEADPGDLSPRELTHLSMDQTALEGTLGTLLAGLDHAEPAYRDPDVLTPRVLVLTHQAYQLAGLDPDRARALCARLSGLGGALAEAREKVSGPDATLLEDARERLAPAREILGELPAVVLRQLRERPDDLRQALTDAVSAAQAAVVEHRAWLDGLEGVDGAAALGQDALADLLARRRFEMGAADAEEVARTHIEEMRIELRRLKRRVFKRLSFEEALATARSQQPYSAEEAASWLEELASQSRTFCLETGVFPMTDDSVVVEDASPASRQVFGEMLFLPAARDGGAPARLLVNDPGTEPGLLRLSVADLEALSARWLFPGAALHAQLGRREHSFVRLGGPMGLVPALATSYGSDLQLGWRLHAEELMRELQFRESPAARMLVCQRALIDGILAWFDTRLHRGADTPAEATRALTAHTDLEEAEARRLVAGLLRSPGLASGAVVGKARLMQLRRAARVKWRHGYAERRFHDLVLGAGALPVAVLFGLLDEFSPFSVDEGTVEYELDERPGERAPDEEAAPDAPLPGGDDGRASPEHEAAAPEAPAAPPSPAEAEPATEGERDQGSSS